MVAVGFAPNRPCKDSFSQLSRPQDIEAEPPSARGRITIYCLAESLDRKLLQRKLEERGPRFLMHKYPDVLYGQYSAPGAEHAAGDIFYFDYGCITFWGLSQKQARAPGALTS